MRKTREEALETRERLLESALDIMSEKSFSRVSMNEIAERVGLSKGAIYWHFKNKNAILVNLIEYILAEAEANARKNGYPEIRSMRAYFKNKMTEALHNDRFKKVHLVFQRRFEWPDEVHEKIMSIMMDTSERERKEMSAIISRYQRDGKIRGDIPAADLAILIDAIFHGLFIAQIHGIYPIDLAKYLDFIFDAFEKELSPENALEKAIAR